MWYSFHSVGDAWIDKNLLTIDYMLTTLSTRGEHGHPFQLTDAIDKLLQHLDKEEQLAKHHNYNLDEQHALRHQRIRRRLESIRGQVIRDRAATAAAAGQVKDLLASHIRDFDRYLVTNDW